MSSLIVYPRAKDCLQSFLDKKTASEKIFAERDPIRNVTLGRASLCSLLARARLQLGCALRSFSVRLSWVMDLNNLL